VRTAVEGPQFELRRNLAVLRRRKWSVLAVTAVVVGGAFASSFLQPPVYRSKCEVLVQAVSLVPTEPSGAAAVNMKVERQVAISSEVRERADAKLDREGVAIEAVSVDVAQSDFILHFTATAADPPCCPGS
jgi:uncharacterized protein involved in exopolysaccharide biosynthesis